MILFHTAFDGKGGCNNSRATCRRDDTQCAVAVSVFGHDLVVEDGRDDDACRGQGGAEGDEDGDGLHFCWLLFYFVVGSRRGDREKELSRPAAINWVVNREAKKRRIKDFFFIIIFCTANFAKEKTTRGRERKEQEEKELRRGMGD